MKSDLQVDAMDEPSSHPFGGTWQFVAWRHPVAHDDWGIVRRDDRSSGATLRDVIRFFQGFGVPGGDTDGFWNPFVFQGSGE